MAGYGADRFLPGDGIICNDGFRGGVHLNDVCLVGPVFHREQLVAFVAALAHHVDVGGATPGSLTGLSKEVFAEGLRMPPIRLLKAGTLDDDIFRLIENNIRSPQETGGDIRAQIASINTGARSLGELYEKNGAPAVESLIDGLLDYTARRTTREIRKLPEGTYSAVGDMDGDGIIDEPFHVKVAITIRNGKVTFDLTGSDRQRKGPVNSTYAMTLSNCAYPLRVLMDPDLPVNDGFYRAITVIAPPGTVVNALPPAAIGGGWETAMRVCETALQAFGQSMPERIAAGSKGCLCNIAFGGISPRSGRYYVFYEAQGGGYGARATKDGIDAVQAHGQNTENAPVEETEANYPVTIPRYELIPDSEGAGQFRGGSAAAGLHFRPRSCLLRALRTGQVPALGSCRRPVRTPGQIHSKPRHRASEFQFKDVGGAPTWGHFQRSNWWRWRFWSSLATRTRQRLAGHGLGKDFAGARAKRLRCRYRPGDRSR